MRGGEAGAFLAKQPVVRAAMALYPAAAGSRARTRMKRQVVSIEEN
jgi:hypothetical protein